MGAVDKFEESFTHSVGLGNGSCRTVGSEG
jgi:hypothetical protein